MLTTLSITDTWKALFRDWPDSIPRQGIAVNNLGETTPFRGFMLSDEMLLLERNNPDSLGSRYILMAFDTISSIRFVNPMTAEAFRPLGLEGRLS